MYGRSADLLKGQHSEQLTEPGDLLFDDGREGFRCAVTPRQPGATSRHDDVDLRVLDPFAKLGCNAGHVIGNDGAVRQNMAVLGNAPHQKIAGFVIGFSAGVGHGHHSDIHRLEIDAHIETICIVRHLFPQAYEPSAESTTCASIIETKRPGPPDASSRRDRAGSPSWARYMARLLTTFLM